MVNNQSAFRKTRTMRNTLAATGVVVLSGLAAQADDVEVKLGVIMEARPGEQPWSASLFESIERLEAEDPTVSHSKAYNAYDPTKSEPIARQLLAEGHNVMIFHSYVLNDVAHTLAAEFPEVPMAVASWDTPKQPNLSIITMNYAQMAYSTCWILARASETGVIGVLGAVPLPYAKEMEAGCAAGADAASPGTEVITAYSNSFTDQQATREQANSLVGRGADVLYPVSASQDSLGAYQLCEQSGILCSGWGSDASRYAPNTGLGATMIDWSVMLKEAANQLRSGELEAYHFIASFENDGLIPQPLTGPAAGRITDADHEDFALVLADLRAGKIEMPAIETE